MTDEAEILRRNWFVASNSSSLGKHPIGVTVCGVPLVLYRTHDEVTAAVDRCPHRNAPLSKGYLQENRLHCPYHGWSFDGLGKCVAAPGLSPDCLPSVGLIRWRAVERDGWVWVAQPSVLSQAPAYIARFARDARYEKHTFTSELDAGLADAIENLLDGTHTPFVHSGLVRSRNESQRFTAEIRREEHYIEAEYRGEKGQKGLISRLFEPERDRSFGRYVPPSTAELEYCSPHRVELFVEAHFTPTLAGKVKVFVATYVPKGRLPSFVRRAAVRWFFGRVLDQDRKILKLQRENLDRFAEPSYSYWKADLIRPWIDAWLKEGVFPAQPDGPDTIEFEL